MYLYNYFGKHLLLSSVAFVWHFSVNMFLEKKCIMNPIEIHYSGDGALTARVL